MGSSAWSFGGRCSLALLLASPCPESPSTNTKWNTQGSTKFCSKRSRLWPGRARSLRMSATNFSYQSRGLVDNPNTPGGWRKYKLLGASMPFKKAAWMSPMEPHHPSAIAHCVPSIRLAFVATGVSVTPYAEPCFCLDGGVPVSQPRSGFVFVSKARSHGQPLLLTTDRRSRRLRESNGRSTSTSEQSCCSRRRRRTTFWPSCRQNGY